jgi:hypothetical protein
MPNVEVGNLKKYFTPSIVAKFCHYLMAWIFLGSSLLNCGI